MRYHGRFENEKPKKKKKKMKRGMVILLVVVGILLTLAVAGAAAGSMYYKSMLNKVNYIEMPTQTTTVPATTLLPTTLGMENTTNTDEATETTEETTVETTIPPMKPEDIINILVVGQSGRAGEDAKLADTMILASVNTYTKTLTLTSFLRDTYVDLPDYRQTNGRLRTCGWNKLTSCYALGYSFDGTVGAMSMMNSCLELNFGVEVDYNVEIDFDCFIKLVDILGGVGLEITQAEADYLNDDDLFVYGEYQAGYVSLDGSAALSYARMRKAEGDNDSDIKRTSRQRYLIEALLNNVKSASLSQLQSILNEILPMVTTNMSPEKITELLVEMVPMLPQLSMQTGTCPVEKLYWSEERDTPDGRMYVLVFDAGEQKRHMRAITEGELMK